MCAYFLTLCSPNHPSPSAHVKSAKVYSAAWHHAKMADEQNPREFAAAARERFLGSKH